MLKQLIKAHRQFLGMSNNEEFDFMSTESLRTWLRRYTKLKHDLQQDPTRLKRMDSMDIASTYNIDAVDAIAFTAHINK